MTNEEAINWLKSISFVRDHHITEAIDMAIEALSADAVSRKDTVTLNSPISIQAEMVAVVRCKDCKHRYVSGNGTTQYYVCDFMDAQYEDDGFCHHGESEGEG